MADPLSSWTSFTSTMDSGLSWYSREGRLGRDGEVVDGSEAEELADRQKVAAHNALQLVCSLGLPASALPRSSTAGKIRSLRLARAGACVVQLVQIFMHFRYEAIKLANAVARESASERRGGGQGIGVTVARVLAWRPLRVAIIGSGAMAKAVVAALLDSGTIAAASSLLVVVREPDASRHASLARRDVTLTDDMHAAAKVAEVVVVAVPAAALGDLKERAAQVTWMPTTLAVSLAVGASLARVKKALRTSYAIRVAGSLPCLKPEEGDQIAGMEPGEQQGTIAWRELSVVMSSTVSQKARSSALADVLLARRGRRLDDYAMLDASSAVQLLADVNQVERRANASPALPISQSVLGDELLGRLLETLIAIAIDTYHIPTERLEELIENVDAPSATADLRTRTGTEPAQYR
ncbi:uncharacterized protein AMSG_05361 [Thecamonas trahens ATCC 50062]|uniref:Pyrroline-5-carboxylate reductase catalytic N-terminal domain-containing protein n=1 Tax=Thecamonas trahens ATCC 50062 TaxID=461836 RepID=A0A0L0DDG4_THETB|nr:hypothetical protein AMSG_05361 [Thecamonas trahens ATCC 50062]KNC49363.1 hypothetical protein AMSG_05361 [Thecamonas trahens ATCC 50062]|eukprot:XP_013757788.1 hypothetical protein AMSG_05361 [Thecamonas trahens ATCC 50062]